MEPNSLAQRALMLRRLAQQNSASPLLRDGYLHLAEELERKARQAPAVGDGSSTQA